MLNINYDYPCSPRNYTMGRYGNTRPRFIGLHYTGGTGSALDTVADNVVNLNENSQDGSAHFFVGLASENGQIYASVPEDSTAWGWAGNFIHPEARNYNTIHIEMCCHNDTPDKTSGSSGWYFDQITIDNTLVLVRQLMTNYGIPIENVLRHFDATGKICPSPFVTNPVAWMDFRARLVVAADPAAEYKRIIQEHCHYNNPDGVWAVLDKHPYAFNLYQKWAESYGGK